MHPILGSFEWGWLVLLRAKVFTSSYKTCQLNDTTVEAVKRLVQNILCIMVVILATCFTLHFTLKWTEKVLRLDWAWALVLWSLEETHFLKVVGSNLSTGYWVDIFSHWLLENCNVCLKRPKINEKEAGDDPFKKV